MDTLGLLLFSFQFAVYSLGAAIIARSRRLTLLGRIVGLSVIFLGIRYAAVPSWNPDGDVAYGVKAVLEILFLHSLAIGVARCATMAALSERGGLVSDLVFRLFFVAGLYVAFYDVIASWPIFGQLWFWAYVLIMYAVVGWISAASAKGALSTAENAAAGGRNGRVALHGGMSCLGMILVAVLSVATSIYFVACIVSSDYRRDANRQIEDIVAVLREKVSERMTKLSQKTSGLVALWDSVLEADRKILDARRAGTADIRSRRAVRRSLAELREMLLPLDSRDILDVVKSLDGKISKVKAKISKENEVKLFHPDRAEKSDRRIAELEKELATLEAGRTEASRKILSDLEAIGIHMEGETAERCLFSVNVDDLVDNAIVAKNVAIVVESLKQLMAKAGDIESAKRYFGTYLVMIDVQSECYRRYIAKSESGVWNNAILNLRNDAQKALLRNKNEAADAKYAEGERAAFEHNVKTNERVIAAADAHLAILKQHEDIVRGKLAEAERLHTVALNSYETVSIAGGLLDQINANQDAFDAMLELTIPAIGLFDDTALQEEFDAITQKLKGE